MRLSTRGEYGFRAMLDLAQRSSEGLVQARVIAARQSIPPAYLNHLMTSLRRAGLIVSIRGPGGGHSLARSPSLITLGQILEALQGPYSPVECVAKDMETECRRAATCALRQVWQEIKGATEGVLGSRTLADLLRMEREQAPTYHI